MRKLYTLLAAVLLTATVWAQSPNKMSYQAVVRDANNELVSNADIGMQISILQGTADGSSVYTETQTPSSNGNGLVSLQIGTGNTADNFSAIDWSSGPYFIKTETDPTGGTSYTITGTSQLMSVPYALYAASSGSSTPGPQGEVGPQGSAGLDGAAGATGSAGADGVGVAQTLSQTGNAITLSDGGGTVTISDSDTQLDAAGVTDLGFTSGAHTTYTAGSGIDITSNVITSTVASPTVYTVGDFAQGGIVFWVDESGQHGLVCAKLDQSSGVRWYAGTYGNTQAKGRGIYSGESNTSIIIAAQVAIGDDGNTYAARICNELTITENGTNYGDWYLPGLEEIQAMYTSRSVINTTATANGGSDFAPNSYYWSSFETGSNLGWKQSFNGGGAPSNDKTFTFRVRAVRAF